VVSGHRDLDGVGQPPAIRASQRRGKVGDVAVDDEERKRVEQSAGEQGSLFLESASTSARVIAET